MIHRIAGKVKQRMFDHKQIWRHNQLMGKVKMAQVAMQEVYDAETVTDECRLEAAKLEGQLGVLFRKIHTRRDHINGTR